MADQNRIYLQDIDSAQIQPDGKFRWLDVADQAYSNGYQNYFNYTQSCVWITYQVVDGVFHGVLMAKNLKPNFAYQLKI